MLTDKITCICVYKHIHTRTYMCKYIHTNILLRSKNICKYTVCNSNRAKGGEAVV